MTARARRQGWPSSSKTSTSMTSGLATMNLTSSSATSWMTRKVSGRACPSLSIRTLTAIQSIHVHFKTREDIEAFAKLIGQNITEDTKSLWYPKTEIVRYGEAV